MIMFRGVSGTDPPATPPGSCFGREHGRNKGEFNSLGGRQAQSLPVSLTGTKTDSARDAP